MYDAMELHAYCRYRGSAAPFVNSPSVTGCRYPSGCRSSTLAERMDFVLGNINILACANGTLDAALATFTFVPLDHRRYRATRRSEHFPGQASFSSVFTPHMPISPP